MKRFVALAVLLCLCGSAKAGIVVLGDSVAHGAGDENNRGGIAGRLGATNAGVNGARTRDVAALLRKPEIRAMLRDSDRIVLSIGGNDMYGDAGARLMTFASPRIEMNFTMARVLSIVQSIERINPRAHIYLLGLYDPYFRRDLDVLVARWNGLLLERFGGDARVSVVMIADLFPRADRLSSVDHFHPSAESYTRIARRISDAF